MCRFLLHDFRLAHFTFIPAGLPEQIRFIPILVRIGSAYLSYVPPVRLACLCDRIVSNGSRSVAMGCCPADSFLLASDRSIAVDVRSVALAGVAGGSSERFICHFRGTCIQSVHLSEQLASAGCSHVSFDRFPACHSRWMIC